MGVFVAKVKKDDDRWYKLIDRIDNEDYTAIDLSEALPYDPDNMLANQWFKLELFHNNEAFLEILSREFDTADLESINKKQYINIDFIAFYEDGKFYIQNITQKNYLTKKWFSFNDQNVYYKYCDNIIYINSIPNCIYDQQADILYFENISKAYSIFRNLKMDYKEATNENVTEFLESDIICTQNFDCSKVGMANRKRITSVSNIYNGYNDEQKGTLKEYIFRNLGNSLEFQDDRFLIRNDAQLRLLLLGMQQRFYQPPLSEEVQVATSTTKLSNLL